MSELKKFFKIIAGCLSVLAVLIFGLGAVISYTMPSEYSVIEGDEFYVEGYLPLKVKLRQVSGSVQAGSIKSNRIENDADMILMESIPIKNINIRHVKENKVIPCGTPFGIKIFTEGVVIVGTSDVQVASGICNPAREAGLRKGDVIISINNNSVNCNEDVANIVEQCAGKKIEICARRNNINFNTELVPAKSLADGRYKAGVWVRDSSAGIGTLTFYDVQRKCFAGLGHGICDIDTGELLPLLRGDVVKASINGVIKGRRGTPGELKGYFVDYIPMGSLYANTDSGVYGSLERNPTNNQALVVAMKQQVRKGEAQILTTIEGDTPKCYNVHIDNVNYNEKYPTKNMIITITDKTLLDKTGGIVQGMSGSPIIQNGMLVGAVTHVFVNEPTRGYGIFAENMLNNSTQLSNIAHKNVA